MCGSSVHDRMTTKADANKLFLVPGNVCTQSVTDCKVSRETQRLGRAQKLPQAPKAEVDFAASHRTGVPFLSVNHERFV